MPVPASTAEYYAAQQILAAEVLVAVRHSWDQVDPTFLDASWGFYGRRILAALAAAQAQAASDGANYVPLVLAELGITAPAQGAVDPATLAGVASSGAPLMDVLNNVLIDTKASIGSGATVSDALKVGGSLLDGITLTQVADASRVAAGVSIASRTRLKGYVRMLNPPSCSRCVVLAGRFYRWNKGFERHPRCDCRHIPVTEDAADDVRTDPKAYFDSLTREQQDAAFTKSGAQAIRDGADISKVVNARSGMHTAGGRTLTHADRANRRGGIRLMPEQIYREATDRADAIRLLKRFGYLL